MTFHLTFMVTSRCNAACSHCSTSCGPHRTEWLSREKIISLMDEAAALKGDGGLDFCVSGGEPFLDFPLLRDVVSHAARLGAAISCVSNGYWAASDQKAHALLSQMKEAGLDVLALSTSRFHQQFVKLPRIERALRISTALGLKTHLKFVRAQSESAQDEAMRTWGRRAGATTVQIIPLYPTVREGVTFPERDFQRRAKLPRGRCPAASMNVHERGDAYMCCMPGAFNELLSIGNANESSLAEIHDRFLLGGVQQILRERGPSWFAREIRAAGLGHRLRSSYNNVCDLCTHIAQDDEMAGLARAAATTFEQEQFSKILDLAVES